MMISLKAVHSLSKVFLDLGMSLLVNFRYQPLVKVAPLPLLILLSITSTMSFSLEKISSFIPK